MPRHRLAVALLLRGREQVEIDSLRRALGDPDLDRIPTHLTLVPPVNVREAELGAALALVRERAARTRPFTLTLGPPTTFLPVSPTLYLAVAGVGADADAEAVIRLRTALRAGPFERPETFPFVPHVTLLNPAAPEVLERARTALAAYRAEITLDRVDVLEETDRVWRSIADFRFGATAIVGRGSWPLQITDSSRLDPEAHAFRARKWQAHDHASYGPGTRWVRAPFAITARRESSVVGVATGWTGFGVAYLSELLVAATVRGEGIGSHLLAAFEAGSRARDCLRLALRTDSGSRAQAFYEARGWRVEAAFADWLAGHDFVQLRRDL